MDDQPQVMAAHALLRVTVAGTPHQATVAAVIRHRVAMGVGHPRTEVDRHTAADLHTVAVVAADMGGNLL
jgi:hypothetical protein